MYIFFIASLQVEPKFYFTIADAPLGHLDKVAPHSLSTQFIRNNPWVSDIFKPREHPSLTVFSINMLPSEFSACKSLLNFLKF